MANKYYSISTSTPKDNIKAALIDKYGAGVTINYESSTVLIFTCAALSDKVIKLESLGAAYYFHYGDAYSSGTTITNSVQFGGIYTGSVTAIHLVLGDDFLLFNSIVSDNSFLVLIGTLTNGKYICYGVVGNSSYTNYVKGYLTDGTAVTLHSLGSAFNNAGKLYKTNAMIIGTGNSILTNIDGTFATINGLYNISYSSGVNNIVITANSIFTSTNLFLSSADRQLLTSLFAEF